jgi:hypothetical protein
MPVIFLLSAAVSGIALLVLLHQITARLWRRPVERETVQAMARWLWFFLILTITLELLEIMLLAYENSDAWHIISQLLTTRLEFSFISIQMIVGSLVPFILLAIVVTMNRYLHDRVRNTLAVIASLLLLVQVFACAGTSSSAGALLEVVPRPALRVPARAVRSRGRPRRDRALYPAVRAAVRVRSRAPHRARRGPARPAGGGRGGADAPHRLSRARSPPGRRGGGH